jgi:hypothetical protein
VIASEAGVQDLPENWWSDLPTVIVDPDVVTAGGRLSTLGPGVVSSEAGFLAGAAAGLATETGLVGLVEGADSGEADAFHSGFEQGVRYMCPKCRLEVVPDAGDPSFSMDVVGIAPGADLGQAGGSAPWIVVYGDVPTADWADRTAARIHPAPEALVAPAMQAVWDGEAGRAWDFAAVTGSLVTEIDSRAISPGRERLLREAEANLRDGYLVVGGAGG